MDHHRVLPPDLGEGARLGPEIIDDPGFGGDDIGGTGRIPGLDLHDPRRKLARWEGASRPRIQNGNIPQRKLRTWIRDDLNGNERACEIARGCSGGSIRAGRLQHHRNAGNVDGDASIVVPGTPERIDQTGQIGLCPTDESRGIGRRIGLQALKGRCVLQGLLQVAVVRAHHDVEGIRQGLRAWRRWRIATPTEPTEEIESDGRRDRQSTEQNAN
jgi:hypothetical protein